MAEGMTEVLMPLMGEGITEATLVRWLKKPGETVRKEEPLLEISTDKVDTEIPSPASGVLLATLAKDGETVAVNAVIATIGDGAADVQTGAPSRSGAAARPAPAPTNATGAVVRPAAATSAPQPAAAAVATAGGGEATAPADQTGAPRSSPLVRKIAKAEGIDLNRVRGSGLGGRITRRDVESHLNGGPAAVPPPSGAAALPPQARGAPGTAHLEYGRVTTRQENGRELLDGVPVRREKMSKIRALTAEHMARSVRTSPHVTTVFEIDMHRVVATREREKAAFQAREGFNLTYTHIISWAAVQAIKRFPVVNVSVDGEDILWKDTVNLGVAVAIDTGLIVPVVRNAGELNVLGMARRLNDLTVRARTKKLMPDDLQGGTFSITNPGMFGSVHSSPIINQPQVAILSVGAIIKRPVVIGDLIGIRPLCQIGLTFDHRVVDGEGGASYLAALKEILESFAETVG